MISQAHQRMTSLHVSSTVELQSGLKTNDALDISGGLEFAQALFGSVQTVDIGLMMLGVMKSHDL